MQCLLACLKFMKSGWPYILCGQFVLKDIPVWPAPAPVGRVLHLHSSQRGHMRHECIDPVLKRLGMFWSVSLSVYISPSICPFVCLSIPPFVCLFIHLYVCMSNRLSVPLSFSLFAHHPIHQTSYLNIWFGPSSLVSQWTDRWRHTVVLQPPLSSSTAAIFIIRCHSSATESNTATHCHTPPSLLLIVWPTSPNPGCVINVDYMLQTAEVMQWAICVAQYKLHWNTLCTGWDSLLSEYLWKVLTSRQCCFNDHSVFYSHLTDSNKNMTSYMESEANQHTGLIKLDVGVKSILCIPLPTSFCHVKLDSLINNVKFNCILPLSNTRTVTTYKRFRSHMTDLSANLKTLEASYQPVENQRWQPKLMDAFEEIISMQNTQIRKQQGIASRVVWANPFSNNSNHRIWSHTSLWPTSRQRRKSDWITLSSLQLQYNGLQEYNS